MATERKPYDLSLPLKNIDGRPLTPAMMGIPPTYDETKDENWSDTPADCKVDSYVTDACPVSRAIIVALLADEKEGDEKKTAKQKKAERAEKEKRYEIATSISMKNRDNTTSQVNLSDAEVELILDRCSDLYGTVPHGCVKNALKTPVIAETEAKEE